MIAVTLCTILAAMAFVAYKLYRLTADAMAYGLSAVIYGADEPSGDTVEGAARKAAR